MTQLLIETSTEQAIAALVKDGQLLASGDLPFGYSSSKHLLPEIEKALQKCQLKIKDLTAIVVGVGPGSYTGIRVGVATAKALAFAGQKPLIGLCSLETFNPPHEGSFAVLIDAKIGGAFVITGVKKNGNISYTSKAAVVELEKLGDLILPITQLLCPNSSLLQSKLQILYPKNTWVWISCSPDPMLMAARAEEKLAAGVVSQNGEIEILYLRKTQAEIEKERNI